MEVKVFDTICWCCGKHKKITGGLTDHHGIPKNFSPKKNFIVPVCQVCHDRINAEDHASLVKFAFKIQKSFDELVCMVSGMVKNLRIKGGRK